MVPAVIVVTPVKNEAANLDRFLAVTSRFADHIIVADQMSTDGSAAIAARHAKVTLIRNDANEYSEAVRQRLLLDTARALVRGPRIILALDADEILAADAIDSPGWHAMLAAAPGTVLCFEKPDLYRTTATCIRYRQPWPLGYVDDGASHEPKEIHSIRIPVPDAAPRLHVDGVRILHYGLVRLEGQRAKNRMYCVIENVRRTSPVWRRRAVYAANFDWTTRGQLGDSPREWFEGWERLDIDVTTVPPASVDWYDNEVLRYFKEYGVRRFWADDIWDRDWEACRQQARQSGLTDVPDARISPPPAIFLTSIKLVDRIVPIAKSVRHRLTAGRAS
jgi:glycosyltransferase involved in cell wall biosynthesis